MDLDSLTAATAVRALKAGTLSSVELLDAQAEAMEKHNPTVNAVVANAIESAKAAAKNADHRRAVGEELGALSGLPLTIKDTFETVGLPTTAGSSTLEGYLAETDADVVKAMRTNGAIIYGKTNVPLFAGDHQTYNAVYGQTNNPWDVNRTAGGSSGGAAVAVATGMSLAEFGSDIGGSIRQPAHMNGVFGLKPSHGVVSMRGHIPGPPGTMAHSDLSVVGPLGRSIDDLELMLRTALTVNPFRGVPGAALPASAGPPEAGKLRLGIWADESIATVAAACRKTVLRYGAEMESAGAAITEKARPKVLPGNLFSTYLSLLWPIVGAGMPDDVWHDLDRQARAADPDDMSSVAPKLMTASHKAWLRANEARAKIDQLWATAFEDVDAFLMPAAPTQPFLHNTEKQYMERVVDVDGINRPYMDTLYWAGLATSAGLPSVVIPATPMNGLPVGVQIVGPKYSDFKLLDIARTICDVTDSKFVPPPATQVAAI